MISRIEMPAVSEGPELVDRFMADIEPDLTSAVFPTLAVKYKGETPAEKQAREERYPIAIAECKKRLAEHAAQWDGHMRNFQHAVAASLEQDDLRDEGEQMGSIEAAIAQS